MTREQRIQALFDALDERIVLLDGAMGTMIQRYGLGGGHWDLFLGEHTADGC